MKYTYVLFDSNPPSLSPVPPDCLEVVPPSCFSYNHLDARISLKETISMPALIPNLSTTVDKVLNDIKKRKIIPLGDIFLSAEYRKGETYDHCVTLPRTTELTHESFQYLTSDAICCDLLLRMCYRVYNSHLHPTPIPSQSPAFLS